VRGPSSNQKGREKDGPSLPSPLHQGRERSLAKEGVEVLLAVFLPFRWEEEGRDHTPVS